MKFKRIASLLTRILLMEIDGQEEDLKYTN